MKLEETTISTQIRLAPYLSSHASLRALLEQAAVAPSRETLPRCQGRNKVTFLDKFRTRPHEISEFGRNLESARKDFQSNSSPKTEYHVFSKRRSTIGRFIDVHSRLIGGLRVIND